MRCSPRALYGAAVGFAAGVSLYESERPLPAAVTAAPGQSTMLWKLRNEPKCSAPSGSATKSTSLTGHELPLIDSA